MALTPTLYVAGETDDSPPGVYYGTWGPADNLCERFSTVERMVAVDDLLQAAEACEQLDSPLIFLGPRDFGSLKPGMTFSIDNDGMVVPDVTSPDPSDDESVRSTLTNGSRSGGCDAQVKPKSYQAAMLS